MEKNKNVEFIPFGFMCVPGMFVRDYGFRRHSYPFDWLESSLEHNIEMINCDFSDLLNEKYLSQPFPDHPNIVENTKWHLKFYHVFDPTKTYAQQKKRIQEYFHHRICNLSEAFAHSHVVLIRYVRDSSEMSWIKNNFGFLKSWLEAHNSELWLIVNDGVTDSFPGCFRTFKATPNATFETTGEEIVFEDLKHNISNLYDCCSALYPKRERRLRVFKNRSRNAAGRIKSLLFGRHTKKSDSCLVFGDRKDEIK